MKFYNDGAVNFPYLSDGMWFLTQHKRWGLLKERPRLPRGRQADQPDRALQAGRGAREGQRAEGPDAHVSKLIDGVVWDGKDPKKYADGFSDARRREPEDGHAAVFHMPAPTRSAASPRPPSRRRPRSRRRRRSRRGEPRRARRRRRAGRGRLRLARARARARIVAPLLGIALLIAIWALLTHEQRRASRRRRRPSTRRSRCSADPFYRKGPNDQGIGWNILSRSQRVGDRLRPRGAGRHPARLHDRPLRVRSTHGRRRSSACCGRSRRSRGCRSACCVFKARQPGGDLDDLHLLASGR